MCFLILHFLWLLQYSYDYFTPLVFRHHYTALGWLAFCWFLSLSVANSPAALFQSSLCSPFRNSSACKCWTSYHLKSSVSSLSFSSTFSAIELFCDTSSKLNIYPTFHFLPFCQQCHHSLWDKFRVRLPGSLIAASVTISFTTWGFG